MTKCSAICRKGTAIPRYVFSMKKLRRINTFLFVNSFCLTTLIARGFSVQTDTNGQPCAFATDYLEKSFASFPRSYPDGMSDSEVDAIAYSPAGFLWDNAISHQKTLHLRRVRHHRGVLEGQE